MNPRLRVSYRKSISHNGSASALSAGVSRSFEAAKSSVAATPRFAKGLTHRALLLLLSFGCAATQSGVAPELPDGTAANQAQTDAKVDVHAIQRRDIQLQLTRGLGDFLSRIELEPSLEGGKFQGFRVVALTDPELWAGVDLQVGDVVKRVNGADLEAPDTVFNTFVALKTAREVTVELVREGQPEVLRFPIIGEPLNEPATSSNGGAVVSSGPSATAQAKPAGAAPKPGDNAPSKPATRPAK